MGRIMWTGMRTNLILVCHAAQTDIDGECALGGVWVVSCLLCLFIQRPCDATPRELNVCLSVSHQRQIPAHATTRRIPVSVLHVARVMGLI